MDNLKLDYEVSAALDFGTTYCGVAYSLKVDYEANPLKLNAEQRNKGDDATSFQKPTTVLVNEEGKFVSFGDDAEQKYGDSVLNKKGNLFLYRHFKMHLHGRQELTKHLVIEDITGKRTIRAFELFRMAIKFWILKLHDLLRRRGCRISDDKIRWVLTVPGMWTERARQYMREAAEEAGIDKRNLLLVYEPEAAAILCKTESVQCQSGELLRSFDPGMTFMVVDMGGGTVDTTVQMVREKGYLKCLQSASGGPHGGNEVNQEFFKFIGKIIGTEKLHELKSDHTKQYLTFEKNFEQEKKTIDCDSTDETNERSVDISIQLPRFLNEEEISKSINNSQFTGKVAVRDGFLQFKKEQMRTFFDRTVENIAQHVESVLKEKPECKCILLVGGFAASPYVEKNLRERFKDRSVFVPAEAGNAILKGAVIFGHNPAIISERVSPFTYGLKTRVTYTDRYPIEKRKKVGDRDVVDNVFQKHIQIGEVVRIGEPLRGHQFNVINQNNPVVFWDVYKSQLEDPLFCEEKLGSTRIGRLEITLEGKGEKEGRLKVKMTCRGTELEAEAIDEVTQKKMTTKLNFFN